MLRLNISHSAVTDCSDCRKNISIISITDTLNGLFDFPIWIQKLSNKLLSPDLNTTELFPVTELRVEPSGAFQQQICESVRVRSLCHLQTEQLGASGSLSSASTQLLFWQSERAATWILSIEKICLFFWLLMEIMMQHWFCLYSSIQSRERKHFYLIGNWFPPGCGPCSC